MSSWFRGRSLLPWGRAVPRFAAARPVFLLCNLGLEVPCCLVAFSFPFPLELWDVLGTNAGVRSRSQWSPVSLKQSWWLCGNCCRSTAAQNLAPGPLVLPEVICDLLPSVLKIKNYRAWPHQPFYHWRCLSRRCLHQPALAVPGGWCSAHNLLLLLHLGWVTPGLGAPAWAGGEGAPCILPS